MKSHHHILILSLCVLSLAALASCRRQDDLYKGFHDEAIGYKYPQRAQSFKAEAGYYKVRLSWLKPTDKSVVRAVVSWDNGQRTMDLDMSDPSIDLSNDTIRLDISPMDEKTYTFEIRTFDVAGNRSMASESSVTVFGDSFVASLVDRSVSTWYYDGEACVIKWKLQKYAMTSTEVRYLSSSGEKTIVVSPDEYTTVITDYDLAASKPFSFRSIFHIFGCLEPLFTPWKEVGFFEAG